jgi:hypothetical protein
MYYYSMMLDFFRKSYLSPTRFMAPAHKNLSAVDLVSCGCRLRLGLFCCSVYDMWGRGVGGGELFDFGVRAALPSRLLRLSLHFPFPIFLSLFLCGGRRFEANGEARLPAATGEARVATATGDPRLAGGGGGGWGDAAPVDEFARELDLLSIPVVFGDVLPLILCGFASFSLPFACCRRVRPGSRFSFSGEVSLISVDLIHSTTFFVCGSADPVFLLCFHFILFVDSEGSFLGFAATVGEFTFPLPFISPCALC